MGALLALAVPFLILIVGAVGKKIVHRKWRSEFLFFGIELTVAAFADVLTLSRDNLLRAPNDPCASAAAKGAKVGVCIAVAVIAFVYVLSTHQDWMGKRQLKDRKQRLFWLAGVSNFVGIAVLALFLLFLH
jgi:hypothetical protein